MTQKYFHFTTKIRCQLDREYWSLEPGKTGLAVAGLVSDGCEFILARANVELVHHRPVAGLGPVYNVFILGVFINDFFIHVFSFITGDNYFWLAWGLSCREWQMLSSSHPMWGPLDSELFSPCSYFSTIVNYWGGVSNISVCAFT